MPVFDFVGPMGSGKTLGMVYMAHRWSLQAGGVPVAANFRLHDAHWSRHRATNPRFKIWYLEDAEQLRAFIASGGGLLLLDEIHRLVDSRLSMKQQNIFLSQFFMFLRKLGVTTLMTHQFERQIDMRIRAVIDVMVHCRRFRSGTDYGHEYRLVDWQTGHGRRIGHRMMDPETAGIFHSVYDTYEFSTKLKFPRTERVFEAYMKQVEEAARNARGDRAIAVGSG